MEGGYCGIEVAVRATLAKLVSDTLESRGLSQEDHDRASEVELKLFLAEQEVLRL